MAISEETHPCLVKVCITEAPDSASEDVKMWQAVSFSSRLGTPTSSSWSFLDLFGSALLECAVRYCHVRGNRVDQSRPGQGR